MKAAWYKKQGSAKSVIKTGDIDTPNAKPGEVRVKIAYSGLNPTDIKRRQGFGGQPQAYPIIIPSLSATNLEHSRLDLPVVMTSSIIRTFAPFFILKSLLN